MGLRHVPALVLQRLVYLAQLGSVVLVFLVLEPLVLGFLVLGILALELLAHLGPLVLVFLVLGSLVLALALPLAQLLLLRLALPVLLRLVRRMAWRMVRWMARRIWPPGHLLRTAQPHHGLKPFGGHPGRRVNQPSPVFPLGTAIHDPLGGHPVFRPARPVRRIAFIAQQHLPFRCQ